MVFQFLLNIFLCIVVSIVTILVIGVIVPVYRFLSRADKLFYFYAKYEHLLRDKFLKTDKIIFSYGKYKKEIYNFEELIKEFETLINDAYEYYDKISIYADIAEGSITDWKKKLDKINFKIIELC